jgi:murein DD-endopeptidase MepM/ murein hydrolase activator NlpD
VWSATKIMPYLLLAVLLAVIALILSPGSAVWRTGESVKTPNDATPTTKIEEAESSKTTPTIRANPSEPKISASPTVALSGLIIPVVGIDRQKLRDTYSDMRSEGRVHNAIDIMAARGTPVLAATNGIIRKISYSERGGNTIYQLSMDGSTVYFYAHLEGYADGVLEGKRVNQGEVIAYVGDTGNAGAGNYHLHFAIWLVSDPKKFYEGENINPYPLLR